MFLMCISIVFSTVITESGQKYLQVTGCYCMLCMLCAMNPLEILQKSNLANYIIVNKYTLPIIFEVFEDEVCMDLSFNFTKQA